MKTFVITEKFPSIDWSFWSREDKKLTKMREPRIAGGNGGNGGEGGHGGNYGCIDIFELGDDSKIKETKISGVKGDTGLGGKGGSGAIRSYIMELTIEGSYWNKLKWSTKVDADTNEKMTSSGRNGADGPSNEDRHDPEPAADSIYATNTINKFKNFMKENSKNPLREAKVNAFLSRLENDEGIRRLYTKN